MSVIIGCIMNRLLLQLILDGLSRALMVGGNLQQQSKHNLPYFMCWQTVNATWAITTTTPRCWSLELHQFFCQCWALVGETSMLLLSTEMPQMMTKRDKVSRYPSSPPSCAEQWVVSSSLLYLRCHWAVTGLERLGNIWLTEKRDRGWLPLYRRKERHLYSWTGWKWRWKQADKLC